jgi:5-methylcytosine-specific restriction endonuclease McrA
MAIDEHYLSVYGRPIGGGVGRRRPGAKLKQEILQKQANCCLYCGLPIGGMVLRRGRVSSTSINWDHFIPYSYLYANPQTNWVASCNICNGIKHSKVYETLAEAQRAIRTRWLELGIEPVSAI